MSCNSGDSNQQSATSDTPDGRPNIVIIVADDLGWNDVGYHGGRMRTPNIDRLASEGAVLDRFYVAPMCSPTRAGLMTGREPIRYGMGRAVVTPWRRYGLDPSETTIAEMLAAAGYEARGLIGKWHLGHLERRWHPLAQGFTYFHGHYNGAIDYFTHERDGERDWHVGYTPSDENGYATDLITGAAVNFIRESAKGGPYLCVVSYNAPHEPMQAPSELVRSQPPQFEGHERTIAAMIASMDAGIGTILQAIEQSKEADNTVVWFMSDNGGISFFKENNLPLRGDKLDVYEGGVRVPSCVRWPLRIPGGRTVASYVSYLDIFPTVQNLAGLHEYDGKSVDGANVLPTLVDGTAAESRTLYFYTGMMGPNMEKVAAIHSGKKLVVVGPDIRGGIDERHRVELFDIATDPGEQNNIAAAHTQTVAALTDKLTAYRELQPGNAIPVAAEGARGFKPPRYWQVPQR